MSFKTQSPFNQLGGDLGGANWEKVGNRKTFSPDKERSCPGLNSPDLENMLRIARTELGKKKAAPA